MWVGDVINIVRTSSDKWVSVSLWLVQIRFSGSALSADSQCDWPRAQNRRNMSVLSCLGSSVEKFNETHDLDLGKLESLSTSAIVVLEAEKHYCLYFISSN